MTMCSQLLTIKRYTIYVLVSIWLSIDSEAAIEITLAGLKQPFCFCSVELPKFFNSNLKCLSKF